MREKHLQMQINPHFLFNTLTMISHTAYLEDDMEIVNLLDITSSLLRYALDYYDRSVSLKKEIEEAGNYVYLQEKGLAAGYDLSLTWMSASTKYRSRI